MMATNAVAAVLADVSSQPYKSPFHEFQIKLTILIGLVCDYLMYLV